MGGVRPRQSLSLSTLAPDARSAVSRRYLPRTDTLTKAVAFTMRGNGPPMPWGYRLLAIFLAVLFIGWMVMVVW